MPKKKYYVVRSECGCLSSSGTVHRLCKYKDGKPTDEVEFYSNRKEAEEAKKMAEFEARLLNKERVWIHWIDFEFEED